MLIEFVLCRVPMLLQNILIAHILTHIFIDSMHVYRMYMHVGLLLFPLNGQDMFYLDNKLSHSIVARLGSLMTTQ